MIDFWSPNSFDNYNLSYIQNRNLRKEAIFQSFDDLYGLPDSLGLWSVSRRVLRKYNGPIIRSRRSIDSLEQDFYGIGPRGEVSITDVQNFAGTGNAHLVTIYDQSNLGRHFTQSITTNQPIICQNGNAITINNRLVARFNADIPSRLVVPSSTTMFSTMHTSGCTVFMVISPESNTGLLSRRILCNREFNNDRGIAINARDSGTFGIQTSRITIDGSLTGAGTAGNSIDFTSYNLFNHDKQNMFIALINPDNPVLQDRVFMWNNNIQFSGNQVATGTPSFVNSNKNLTLGANASANVNAYTGAMSEVFIFASLLDGRDINLYEERSSKFFGVGI